jgi:predicted permease
VRALAAFNLDKTPQGTHIVMNVTVVAFTLALAAVVGLLIGLAPVAGLRQLNLSQAFREEGRSGTASRGSRAMRRILVTAQVAFAFMLLIGAGLLLTSFQRVLAVQPGFDPEHVLTGRVALPASRYREDAELITFSNRLLERVRAVPGVESAGITGNLPLGQDFNDSVILAEGYVMKPGESLISPYNTDVTPGYFEAMRIPLKRGRFFTDSDTAKSPLVTVIDERLATRFFGTADPIGRRLWKPDKAEELSSGPGATAKFYTIVGVVGDIHMRGLTEKQNVGSYYFPVAQDAIRTMTLVARSSGDPDAVTQSIRREIAAIDPELPFYSVQSMHARLEASLLNRRTPMILALLFAGIALFLASVGIYGVLAYQVAQRRREIGIRLALGSNAGRIFQLIVREGLTLLAIGLAIGLAGAVAIRSAMESQLFGVRALDPVVLSSVALVLGTIAFIACALPARRAARIDPLIALTD